jgi:hypothetical protein
MSHSHACTLHQRPIAEVGEALAQVPRVIEELPTTVPALTADAIAAVKAWPAAIATWPDVVSRWPGEMILSAQHAANAVAAQSKHVANAVNGYLAEVDVGSMSPWWAVAVVAVVLLAVAVFAGRNLLVRRLRVYTTAARVFGGLKYMKSTEHWRENLSAVRGHTPTLPPHRVTLRLVALSRLSSLQQLSSSNYSRLPPPAHPRREPG